MKDGLLLCIVVFLAFCVNYCAWGVDDFYCLFIDVYFRISDLKSVYTGRKYPDDLRADCWCTYVRTSRAVIHYVERLIGHDTILRILSKMRVRLYNILEPQALFLSSRFRTGDILGMLADDIEYLQNVYLRTVFPSVIALLIYGVAVIALGTFDIGFALLMALYILVLVVVLPLISLLFTQKRQREVKVERNRLYQKLTDAVLGMGDWVISGRQSQFVETYEADEKKWPKLMQRCAAGRVYVRSSGKQLLGLVYFRCYIGPPGSMRMVLLQVR